MSKKFQIRILHGLPGSGKTTFIETKFKEFCKKSPLREYVRIDVDKLRTDDYWKYPTVYNLPREEFREKIKDELSRSLVTYEGHIISDGIIVDGLFLTNQMIIDAIEDSIEVFKNKELDLQFVIDSWNENRKACRINDIIRDRYHYAAVSIRRAPFERVDIERIKSLFPNYTIGLCKHTVYEPTPKETFFARGLVSVKNSDKIISSDTWSGGGDYRCCWDNYSHPIYPDEDPDRFYELDEFLRRVGVTLTQKDYEHVFYCLVQTETNYDYDCYGGCEERRWYEINIDSLYDFLREHHYIKE